MNRTNSLRFVFTFACALFIAACKPVATGPDPAADSAALDTAASGWEKAYNDKNADGIAALYTDDAQLLPPGAAEVSGRDAIRAYFANDIDTQWARITIRSTASNIGGDWAWRSGTWSAESDPVVTGKYVEVWRRTKDGWRMQKDIWNMDPMPTGEPPVATIN
jgi:uncharacterized protein (TIGR02246 family)